LVRYGKSLDFEVVVVDPAPDLTESPDQLVRDPLPNPEDLSLGGSDSIVVLANGDRNVAVLTSISGTPLRYVGLRTDGDGAEKARAELTSRGVPNEFLVRLRAPIPVDPSLRAPSDIALAILAEVVGAQTPPLGTRRAGAPASSSH
jgi:xanthine/CO dehydrogenase XdhC/CoxF family maturation factor